MGKRFDGKAVLALGTRLGPYEITAQIGVGGMGEVYQVRGSTFDREIPIDSSRCSRPRRADGSGPLNRGLEEGS